MRDEEIKSPKRENQTLDEITKKKEKERNLFENMNKELLDINDKLAKYLSRQFPIQGAKHLLWDMIIVDGTKIRTYLNYIKDKEMVINVDKQSCTTVKEALHRKPTYTTRNTINFLKTFSTLYN